MSAKTLVRKQSEVQPSLRVLGVYGYDDLEPVIWAALTSGDPLLLMGNAGTGKTYLLNSLAEALQLEHRHYNASLISFDDLVGFPYPSENYQSVSYLSTPATVWKAQSILIDEINRCKPEHQNRLFSLIHERRVQGISLDKLQYRWAAQNPPPDPEDPNAEIYEGVEALDPALADRFAFLIEVPDWHQLSDTDKQLVTDPAGTGQISDDNGLLSAKVKEWQKQFELLLQSPPAIVIDYACIVADQLKSVDIRLSPRRVRQIARNLLALLVVSSDTSRKGVFLLALQSSIPQTAYGDKIDPKTVRSVHNTAWTIVNGNEQDRWLAQFRQQRSLTGKVKRLCEGAPNPDTGSIAISQALSSLLKADKIAFVFAVYPAVAKGHFNIGAEGLHALSEIAGKIFDVDGTIQWRGSRGAVPPPDPLTQLVKKLESKISGPRLIRACQLFSYLLTNNIEVARPLQLEKAFNEAVEIIAKHSGLDQ